MRLAIAGSVVALMSVVQLLPAQSNTISLTALGTLTISAALPGGQPIGSTNNTGKYSVNVVSGRMKVTAQLDAPLPPGVTLTITLAAPSGAVSLGGVALNTIAQDVVRYVAIGDYSNLSVNLALSSSVAAGVVPFNTSHITLTLVDDP
jgi:hypothetical protein